MYFFFTHDCCFAGAKLSLGGDSCEKRSFRPVNSGLSFVCVGEIFSCCLFPLF